MVHSMEFIFYTYGSNLFVLFIKIFDLYVLFYSLFMEVLFGIDNFEECHDKENTLKLKIIISIIIISHYHHYQTPTSFPSSMIVSLS